MNASRPLITNKPPYLDRISFPSSPTSPTFPKAGEYASFNQGLSREHQTWIPEQSTEFKQEIPLAYKNPSTFIYNFVPNAPNACGGIQPNFGFVRPIKPMYELPRDGPWALHPYPMKGFRYWLRNIFYKIKSYLI